MKKISKGKKHSLVNTLPQKSLVEAPSIAIEYFQIRNVLEAVTDAFVVFDRGKKYVYVNKKAEKLLGEKSKYLVGHTMEKVFGKLDNNIIYKKILISLQSNKPETYNYLSKDANKWLEVKIFPSIHGVSVSFTDINDRINTEVKLRLSEERYRKLVDLAPDVIYSLDNKGVLVSLSHAFETITGWKVKDWIGKPFLKIVHPQDRVVASQKFKEGLKKQLPPYELRIKNKQGGYIYGEFRNGPNIENGYIVGKIGIARDVTERKEAQKKLTEKEKWFQALIENSSDGVRVINKNNEIIYASPSTKKILGYKPEEYIHQNLLDLIHPDDREGYTKILNEIIKNPAKIANYIYRIKHKDGRWRWLEGYGRNLLSDPTIQGIVSNFRDITERREVEQRKDEFVSMASHELKTPITSMNLFLELLQTELVNSKNQAALKLLQRIKDQTDKLKNLVTDLLDVSRIQVGKLAFNQENFDINELIEDIVESLRGISPRHKIIFHMIGKMMVRGDRYRIYQVLTNLITNAVKYSPKGGNVIVGLKKDTARVIVSVKDQGIGISKLQHDKIFERLYQVGDPEEKTFPGLGMGLYISREIINRHGGDIWFKSKKQKGSTFYFSLPSL